MLNNASRLLNDSLRSLLIAYAFKAPAAAGAFYYFNSLTNPINQPPIPGTVTHKTFTAFTHPAT